MGGTGIIAIPLFIVGGILLLGVVVFLFVKIFAFLWRFIVHVFSTLGAIIADLFRFLGAVIVAVIFIPLILANIVIGRWSASAHYGRAFTAECGTAGACLYRVVIGHPLRLIGLGGLVEGIEQRLPQALAEAPGPDRPSKSQGLFEGYNIIGSLPGGGSGGRLYIAEPDAMKQAAFAKRGHHEVDRVVIKTFSPTDGSSLTQIMRENRALDAAKKLGLILEHESTNERFHYVMRYMPGDSLTAVTQRLHAGAAPAGLDNRGLRLAMGYAADLLETLDVYHRGGLWHKDVKPDNLIVDHEPDPALGRGRAHLVDFGLITPLRSAMTLTTHGTEYFRDPELVRQALRGVKVHEIDGARFDLYAAGAVLFSMIENSFPAHGGLSRVSKRCPEALRWIIRRAMTDYDKRYPSATAMLDDLRVVAAAADPFAVKPADLPSVKSGGSPVVAPEEHEPPRQAAFAAAPPIAAEPAPTPSPGPRPKLRIVDWWTGRYEADPAPRGARPGAPEGFVPKADIARTPRPPARPRTPVGERRSAAEQLANARRRVDERRSRALNRGHHPAHGPTRRAGRPRRHEPAGVNAGVMIAAVVGVVAVFGGVAVMLLAGQQSGSSPAASVRLGARVPPPPAPPGVGSADAPALPLTLVPPATRDLEGLGLIVMCDFRPPFEEALQREFNLAGAGLIEAGVRLGGNVYLDGATEEDEQRLAALLTARAQAPLDDALGVTLREFIRADDAIDTLWWLGPGDRKDRRYLLVTPEAVSAFSSDTITLGEIAAAFRESASNN